MKLIWNRFSKFFRKRPLEDDEAQPFTPPHFDVGQIWRQKQNERKLEEREIGTIGLDEIDNDESSTGSTFKNVHSWMKAKEIITTYELLSQPKNNSLAPKPQITLAPDHLEKLCADAERKRSLLLFTIKYHQLPATLDEFEQFLNLRPDYFPFRNKDLFSFFERVETDYF